MRLKLAKPHVHCARRHRAWALAIAALPAWADPPGPGAAEADAVVITATRTPQGLREVPAAIDALDARTLREMGPQVNLSESLQRVPGVSVLNRQNYAQDLQLSIRGFGARATFGVRGVRLYADGIPGTMPDGTGQSALFDLGSAQRIEVLRGPASALYGNAAGGVVQVFTEDGPPVPELGVGIAFGPDGFNRQHLRVAGETAPEGEPGALNYVLHASRFSTDGFRDHSAARRAQLNGKLRWQLDARTTLTVVGAWLDMPGVQDPLGLPADAWRRDPRAVVPQAQRFNTRKDVFNGQLGAVFERALGDDTLRLMAYGGQRAVTQFQSIPPEAQTARHPGGVIDFERRYGGLDARYTWRTQLAERPLSLTAGVNLDGVWEDRRGFQNFVGAGGAETVGVKGALRRDEDNRARNADQYLLMQWQAAPAWSLDLGLRHSRVGFASRDHYITEGNGDDSGRMRFAALTPTAAVMWRASPDWHWYVAVGRSFETPTLAEVAYRSNLGTETGWNRDLRATAARHREVGWKARPARGWQWQLAAYTVDTDDEIAVATSLGGRATFQNVGRTERQGVETSVRWVGAASASGWSGYLALNWLDARFQDAFSSQGTSGAQTVPAGRRLPGIPARQAYAELAWRPPASHWHTAIEWRHQGAIWANDINTARAPGTSLWALRAGWRLPWQAGGTAWRWDALARIENLFDTRYAGSVIVNEGNGRFFEPAPGRGWLVQTTLTRSF